MEPQRQPAGRADKPTKRAVGSYGERLAERHLERVGMRVLTRNWRCGLGELDLVALDGVTLVGVEVKTRTQTAFGSPLEAITWEKAERLHRLVTAYAREQRLAPIGVRVDCVGVTQVGSAPARLEHLRGIG